MRDGVILSADVYFPTSEGPFPTLLARTIYDNQDARYIQWTQRFVQEGYAVVIQDCRGRYDSEGEWTPYICEATDGYDTQEWMGGQTWCDGNIGTFGISYLGFTQTLTAPLRSGYLKALVPTASQQDNYGHFYVDGALQLHVALNFVNMAGRTMQRGSRGLMNSEELYRRLPLISALDDIVDLPFYREVIQHYTFDDFWKNYSLRYKYSEVDAPAYFVTGWYDNLVHENFKLFHGWSNKARSREARKLSKLLVGPWSHSNIAFGSPSGSIDFGSGSQLDVLTEHIRWYDRRLKSVDNGIDEEDPVHIFVMGENAWRYEKEWPLARAKYTKFYLHNQGDGGVLNTDLPREEPVEHYRYDPEDPVPTLGGQIMAIQTTVSGPWDRRPIEKREDVLLYTTDVLDQDVEVTGPIWLTLFACSNAPDTDFTGTLVDVHEDGKAIIICEGLLRARFRESNEHPILMKLGEIYKLQINMWETSNVFKAGHRIRLEVSSSNFPRFDRNPNTIHTPGMEVEIRVADQTIFHDAERPSHMTLPVIPR